MLPYIIAGIITVLIITLAALGYVKAPPGYGVHHLRLPQAPDPDRQGRYPHPLPGAAG